MPGRKRYYPNILCAAIVSFCWVAELITKGRIPKKLSTKIMKTVLSMVGGVATFH